jgi:predicted nucleotidyltransferase
MAIPQRYKDQLLPIIQKHLPNCKVYLFGSRAIDNEASGSDIDIALDAGEPIPFRTIRKMSDDIEETDIPVNVDLVDLQNASSELRENILTEGILWTS